MRDEQETAQRRLKDSDSSLIPHPPSLSFVDSHAHIDGEEFDADRDEVVERARAAGVRAILNVGTGDPHGGASGA